jgi:hypothetical protein
LNQRLFDRSSGWRPLRTPGLQGLVRGFDSRVGWTHRSRLRLDHDHVGRQLEALRGIRCLRGWRS